MQNKEFIFDGRNSSEFGLQIVKLDSGFSPNLYIGGQEIREINAPNRREPYFLRTEKNVLEFEVTFTLGNKKFTPQIKNQIARWLCKNDYRTFQTTDFIGKMFYVIMTNQSDLQTLGYDEGYFTAVFRCNAGYGFTLPRADYYDLSTNTGTTRITINNESNVYEDYKPVTKITKVGAGSIRLINRTSNVETRIDNCVNGEEIYIDHYNKTIISSHRMYILNDFNKKWFKLAFGVNQIDAIGSCHLEINSQYPIYT